MKTKKYILVLLTLAPVVIGYLINITILVPGLGTALYYVLPLLTAVFWFYLGSRYAAAWRAVPAILIGNAAGILSLLLYVWQCLLVSDEARNTALAGISQMFSASAPGYLLARLAILFELQENYVGQRSATALQVISLVFMIAVFTCGYFWGKTRRANEEAPGQPGHAY